MKTIFFLFFCNCFALFGAVEKSIIPLMDRQMIQDLQGKILPEQEKEIEEILGCLDQSLRVMSFNMLLNWSESHLEPEDRWENRKARVIEYIQWANPDIIGSQELQSDQLDDLLAVIGDEYDYYGTGTDDGRQAGDIPAIFYRKKRFELCFGITHYFSETPHAISKTPFGNRNTYTICQFKDKKTGCEFIAVNTHLAFNNIHRRHYEACRLRDFLLANEFDLPVFITGDFNTFPFRQDLNLPYYDGDKIVAIIEEGNLIDSSRFPLFGHFGPISSTNFCSKKMKPFCSEGDPGLILDHIFVSKGISVLSHGIDPAKVDDHYPSDHFPVIVDMILR